MLLLRGTDKDIVRNHSKFLGHFIYTILANSEPRILEEDRFHRVGGTRKVKVNVRVIVATNKSLEEQVKQNRFREDLFYGLNVVRMSLPPLRER